MEQFQHEPGADQVSDDHAFTREQLQHRIQAYNEQKQRFDVLPTDTQQLGRFTIVCLIMNRTIGTGVFVQPVNVLFLTGSSGVALLLWCVGGLIVFCIVLSWLELALSVPHHLIFHNERWERYATPRSGGDKNYLEYIYKRPKFLMSCIFGIIFIVFGHLAGNAIQFGVFMQTAINPTCNEDDECFNKGAVLGWAITVLTLCAIINIATRRLAIVLNNGFAIVKVLMVVIMAFLGMIYGAAKGDGCRKISWKNRGAGGGFGDIVLALFYAMYPYTGFEQPFYVLAEVRQPRKIFAKYVILAMLIVMVLFPLANVGFLCMTPYDGNEGLEDNMALALFQRIARDRGELREATGSRQGVSVLLAIFIFGNIMAQTYTASRVKQEIAKEAILPWSLQLASGNNALLSRLLSHGGQPAINDINHHLEQVPIAATFLHWAFEILLVLVFGIPLKPSTSYRILTYLKTFSVVGVLGLFTVLGLLFLKLDSHFRRERGRRWYEKVAWRPWSDPLPTAVACAALTFILLATFAPPSVSRSDEELPYWAGPVIGWMVTLLGVLWWLGLRFVQWKGRFELQVRRVPYIEIDHNGEPVQKAEFVEHDRMPVTARPRKRHV
ncbi:amino acid transporter [Sporormia fimetaria CBS 119925]|uniref:Amino acid transporter n=1 Tax=Sporormia fimetaria CBS 119925 TaxID=1340428 RepID=A0A6A6UYY7_9PLEO|nr:amino acid transporter [Sporormia fimetaria CBS 119925]